MKLPSKILLLFLIFIGSNLYGQKDYFMYDKIKISESIAIEKKYNSKEFTSKVKTFYNNDSDDLEQPKNFRRPQTNNFPPATISYFYTKKDSVVKSITYRWNVRIGSDVTQLKKIEHYNAEYDKLIKLLSECIGEPKPNQGKIIKGKETLVGDGLTENYKRCVIWEYKNCKISTILIWSENHGQSLTTTIYYK